MNLRRAIVVTVGMVGLLGLEVPAATASLCPQRGQFFVRNTVSRNFVNGQTNSIELADRFLAQNDSCDTLTLSTAHLNRNDNQTINNDDFIEIGWRRYRLSSGSTFYRIFVEKCSPTGGCVVSEFTKPSSAVVGTFDHWRIVKDFRDEVGFWQWDLRVDFLDGAGYRLYKEYFTSWAHAVTYGETEAFGAASGMHDDQRGLKHKNNSGNWVDWTGQSCDPSFEDGGYRYVKQNQTRYVIEAGQNAAC